MLNRGDSGSHLGRHSPGNPEVFVSEFQGAINRPPTIRNFTRSFNPLNPISCLYVLNALIQALWKHDVILQSISAISVFDFEI